jgi:hypothetical protein
MTPTPEAHPATLEGSQDLEPPLPSRQDLPSSAQIRSSLPGFPLLDLGANDTPSSPPLVDYPINVWIQLRVDSAIKSTLILLYQVSRQGLHFKDIEEALNLEYNIDVDTT